jgi:hypothetical protein
MPNGGMGTAILQVVTAHSDTETSGNTNTWTASPATVSITPQNTNNHILVYTHTTIASNTKEDVLSRLKRGSTIIAVSGTDAHGVGYGVGGLTETWSGYTFNDWWKDSPSSTSAITYTTEVKSNRGDTNYTIWINRGLQTGTSHSDAFTTRAFMMAMEVEG